MDSIDKIILNEIQSSFPVTPRPYYYLGLRINCPEDEILTRIKKLINDGIIRRIGGNFDSKRLGFSTTLCAAKVPDDKLDEFIAEVNKYPEVTHNYLRDHEYNIWFTFIAKDVTIIKNHIKGIIKNTGVEEIIDLPALKAYKILVDFNLD